MSSESFNHAIQNAREAFRNGDAAEFEHAIHRAQATLGGHSGLAEQLASAKQHFPSHEALHIIAQVTFFVSEFSAGICFATR